MHNTNTYWITQWGGIIQGKHDTLIPPGYFYDAVNYCLASDGTLRPRNGTRLLGSLNGKILKFFSCRLKGKRQLFVATSSKIYKYNSTTGNFEPIGINWSNAEKASFALINSNTNPVIVIGNGKSNIVRYRCDGENGEFSTSNLADAPIGLPFAYMNYLGVYAMPNHPNAILFTAKNGHIATDDGDTESPWLKGGIPVSMELESAVTAVIPFGGGLVIFCENQTYLFRGDPDEPQGLVKLSDNIGCVNNNSCCVAENQLYFISQRGVCCYNGEGRFPTEYLSDPGIERPSNISEDIRRMDYSDRQNFSIAYDNINRRLFCCISHRKKQFDGEIVKSLFVFEFRNASWYRWNFKDFEPVVTGFGFVEEKLLVGGSNSRVYSITAEANSESYTDEPSGNSFTDVEYSLKSGAMDMGTMEYDKLFRALTLRILPNFNGYEGFKEIDIYGYADFQPTEQKANFHASFSFIMGVSQMGDRLQMDYPTEQRRPIALKSKYFAFEIIGKGKKNSLPICGIGISFRAYSKRSTMTWDNDLL